MWCSCPTASASRSARSPSTRPWARPTRAASSSPPPASTPRRRSTGIAHPGKGRPFFYFAYGAAVSEVAIDTLTGENRILRTDILHDVGQSLNPAIDLGQIEGGFVQGVGWLTTEELVWDEKGAPAHARALDLQDPRLLGPPHRPAHRALEQGAQRRGHHLPLQGRGRAAADARHLRADGAVRRGGERRRLRGLSRARRSGDARAHADGGRAHQEPQPRASGVRTAPMSWIADIARGGWPQHGAVVRRDGDPRPTARPRARPGRRCSSSAGHIADTIGGGARSSSRRSPHARATAGRTWPRPGSATCATSRSARRSANAAAAYAQLLFELFTARERPHLEALARIPDADAALVLRPLESGASARNRIKPQGSGRAAARRHANLARHAVGREAARGGSDPRRQGRRCLVHRAAGAAHDAARSSTAPGHVGRALVRGAADLPLRHHAGSIPRPSRFPDPLPTHVQHAGRRPILPALASAAPAGAWHIVMTYAHALDLAICHAVLRRGDFGHLGLIGSATKRARFMKRLTELGIPPAALARLTCPIGLPGLGGKEPGMIAVAVAAQLMQLATAERAGVGRRPARVGGRWPMTGRAARAARHHQALPGRGRQRRRDVLHRRQARSTRCWARTAPASRRWSR